MSHRPTLPPLRTLGLPNPCSNLKEQMTALRFNDTNDSYDSLPPMRNLSISTSITNVSRSSNSPPPAIARTKLLCPSSQHNVSHPSTNPNRPRRGYRLVLSTLDDADALLIVPDSGEQSASGPDSQNVPLKPKVGRGYLLVGEAMHLHLRQKKAFRGARVHPYRFVSSPPSR